MRIVYNNIIPFKGFIAINLFGVLFVRGTERKISDVVLNHEKIHTTQMKELWYIPFYLLYFVEWCVRLFMKGNAYRNISFEREAYSHEKDMSYLATRRRWSMWRSHKLHAGVDLASGEDKSVEIVCKGGKIISVREEKRG